MVHRLRYIFLGLILRLFLLYFWNACKKFQKVLFDYFSSTLVLFGNVFHSVLLYFIFSFCFCISSVIMQKDESQNRSNKKSKHAKFSEKRTFLASWYARVRIWVEKMLLFFCLNLASFLFLSPPVWDLLFCLIIDELQKQKMKSNQIICCSSVIRYKKFGSIPREFSHRTFFCSLFKIGFLSLFDDLFLFMPLLFLIAGTYSFL